MINEELKARFLAGECTEEELIALRDILKNSPEEKQKLFKEEKLSDEFKAQFMPRTQLMLAEQRMQAKIPCDHVHPCSRLLCIPLPWTSMSHLC